MIKLHSKKSLFIVLNSLLISMFYFFFNCTSNEDEAEGSLLNMPNIRVEASILNNNQTGSRYSGSDYKNLSFSQNDSICIFMDGKNLGKWLLNNDVWSPIENSIWSDTINTHVFKSFYPYNKYCCLDSVYSPSLIDQDGTLDNLKKYDLLVASKTTSYSESKGVVSFTGENAFKHLLSLIRINILATGEFTNATIDTFKLSSPRLFSRVIYSLNNNNFRIDTSNDINEFIVSPNHNMAGKSKEYYIISTPRDTNSGIKLSITYSNSVANKVEKSSYLTEKKLESGKIYQYNVFIREGKIEIEAPQITSWEESSTIQEINL